MAEQNQKRKMITMQIYDNQIENFEIFQEICKDANTNVTQQFNELIRLCALAGSLITGGK